MNFYKTRINGKLYLYAYDYIFIDKGKKIRKNKSLGPADSPKTRTKKIEEFSHELQMSEAHLRAEYWMKKIANPAFLTYVSVQKIETARTKLYRAKKDMGSIGNRAMETAFLVDFIFNSNKIEGSKVPRESVEKIVRGESDKNSEVSNTLKALNFVNDGFRFTAAGVKKIHEILMAHEPQKIGFRKERVIVNESEVADWDSVKSKLIELLDWLKVQKKTMYPPELAFEFYYRFERIHPFEDGNGRVGRLIMNKILKDNRYHPIIIWDKRRRAHMSAFKKYMRGKPDEYYKFMADQFIKTHDVYIQKIEKAFSLEKQMRYFLQPSQY